VILKEGAIVIRSASVIGLHGKNNHSIEFNEDINIITGRNGAGKTTLMKLIWYLISGNIECALSEIEFSSATVCTDNLTIEVEKKDRLATITWYTSSNASDRESIEVDRTSRQARIVFDINMKTSELAEQTIFFPTFRRVEGGYGFIKDSDIDYFAHHLRGMARELEDSISVYSRRLSVGKHKFVTSLSTEDIKNLLTTRYAEISERTNNLQDGLTQFIEAVVQQYITYTGSDSAQERLQYAVETLEQIRDKVREVSKTKDDFLKPFTLLSDLVPRVFQYDGIKVTDTITLGNAQESIAADKLSAGEKQMLSFLCYNAFFDGAIIFIDEPEISLHVDWQRILISTLSHQGTWNQFVIATHSPFIYAQYEDKEIMLDSDRGGF
jgi:predicted ATPase